MLGRVLARGGRRVPTADLLIAAAARRIALIVRRPPVASPGVLAVLACCAVAALALVPLPSEAAVPGSSPRPGPAGETIATLTVDVWPEHDDPRLLVIYRGTLGPAVPLPATLTFAIHPSGQVNAAAYRSDDGELFTTPHQYRQEADRLLVTITIPTRGFQFEYYADVITGAPQQRAFALDVALPLAVDDLRVSAEQPLRSTAFELAPPAGGTAVTAGGFTHHTYTVGPWPAGRVWRVSGRYRKEDSNPSVPRQARVPVGPPAPVPTRDMTGWWIGALAIGAAGLASLVLVRYRRRGAGRRRAGQPQPGARTGPQGRRGTTGGVYCPQCGARARPKDRYCSRCGTPLVR